MSRIFSQLLQNEILGRTLTSVSRILLERRGVLVGFRNERSLLALRWEPRLLLNGESRSLDNDSLLLSFPVRESFAALSEPLRDFGSRLPESHLFRTDCAECGLLGDSPLRLRAPGAGLCLPSSAKLKITFCKEDFLEEYRCLRV